MSLAAYERETVLRWCDDPSEPLSIYTHSKSRALKLIAKGAKLKRETRHGGRVVAWLLEAPREWFRWPMPKGAPKGAAKLKHDAREARAAHLQDGPAEDESPRAV